MNCRFPLGLAASALLLCGVAVISGSCRKRSTLAPAGKTAAVQLVVAPELATNNLDVLPGAVYRSQAGSPVHWQAWTEESLAQAKAAGRLVFAVVALPQQPGFLSILEAIDHDASLVATLNESYVPVLIDGDASREIGLLTADLCAERGTPVQLPLFLWLTSDANPVAWIPATRPEAVADIFAQAHLMIQQSWDDSRSYVMDNSALDNDSRRNRIAMRKNTDVMSEDPAVDAERGIRQLATYYDGISRTFDEAGGLFPAGSLDLLATAAIQPGVNPAIRERCTEVTRELLKDLLPSAMFDPLDGGLFSARRGRTWSLPRFQRDCASQARAAVALIDAHRATRDPQALSKALGLLTFSEKSFATSDGLFALGLTGEDDPAAWLWTVEDIEEALSPEDAEWWIKATGMTALGNLTGEADPQRQYFRRNSIAMGKTIAEIAAELELTEEDFAPRYELARKALLKIRTIRTVSALRDNHPHAGATFRMISAYAAAYGVTGQAEYRTKAVELLEKARTTFSDGPRLRAFAAEAPNSVGEGRAFLYGLALQAALDVSSITMDDSWLIWCDDLATIAAELFTDAGFLRECPKDATIIDLPITDVAMLFDDSTAGLVSFAECRMAERKRPLVASFSALATPLPRFAAERPVLHTDLLQATMAREFKVTVVVSADAPPELQTAVARLPLRMVQRRAAAAGEEIPPGAVIVTVPGVEPRAVTSVEDLHDAILPPPPNA